MITVPVLIITFKYDLIDNSGLVQKPEYRSQERCKIIGNPSD